MKKFILILPIMCLTLIAGAWWHTAQADSNDDARVKNTILLVQSAESGNQQAQNILQELAKQYGVPDGRTATLAIPVTELSVATFYYNKVPTDRVESEKWTRKAVDDWGFDEAELVLGLLYTGNTGGVALDYVQAYKWVSLASAQGNPKAHNLLAQLIPNMTADQIAQAQEQARAFVPKHSIK